MRRPALARLLASLALAAPNLVTGCSRGAKGLAAPDAGGVPQPIRAAEVSAPPSEAVFSAPIAAALAGPLKVVAGLVASEKVIRVRATRGGSVVWSADVVRGARWAPDVDLRLLPAADGVAILWGGPGASGARTMVTLGAHGDVLEEPTEIGAAACSTADGIAWVDPHRTGPIKVRARRWRDRAVHDAATLPSDRDPSLVCGDHVIFVLGDGDDDLTATAFVPGETDSVPPRVALRDADFGDDDEREHEPYTFGDTLGLVRVASSGAVMMREIPRSGPPTAWRTLKHKLAPEDDVVAVDGDAAATLVVFTHDAEDACTGVGSSAVAIRALRVDRATGAETAVDLAPPDCDVSPGPFWIAPAPGGQAVVWVERTGKLAPNAPPIRRLAVRALRGDGVHPGGTALTADALADGSCDDTGCFAAALQRGDDGDAMSPESIATIAYP
jgi:hypothetical protein